MIKLKARDRLTLQTVLIAIIVIFAVVYALFIRPNYYNFNGGKIALETVYSENLSAKDSYQIVSYNDYIYISSKNGLKKMSKGLENIWDKTFYVEQPLFITQESYMAVVDLGGKQAFTFNEEGLVMTIKVDYPIILADISSEGALVLVEEKEGKHLIQLYTRKGVLAAERGTNFSSDGYPIGIDLSRTGEKMVTSYLSVQEGVMKSAITFFSFEEAGEKDPENILGGYVMEDTMTPEVKFLDDNHIVAVSDNSLNFYNIEGTPKVETQIKVHNQIDQVVYNDENMIVYYGKAIEPSKEDMSGTVVVYSIEGKVVDHYAIKGDVKHLTGVGREYYVITSDTIEYHNSKRMIWKTSIKKDVKSIAKIGKDQYLIVLQQGFEIVKIKDI